MKINIILAGVGGQGILTIAKVFGQVAVKQNLFLKQAEVHGMSQRGGAVQSHLRLSSDLISSDLIPEGAADLIISVEPMEVLRYLPHLSERGWLVTNSSPFINIPDYPEIKDIEKEIKKTPNHIIIDADKIAKELGSSRASNMVMLGAASRYIGLENRSFLEGIKQIFGRKGEAVVDMNFKAFEAGFEASSNYLNLS